MPVPTRVTVELTDDELVAHLCQHVEKARAGNPFRDLDVVEIVDRGHLDRSIAAGDLGVVVSLGLADSVQVLTVGANGFEMVITLPITSLRKR